MKLSFKKHPKETGLAKIFHPYPSTDIRADRNVVGTIDPIDYGNWWSISFMVYGNSENANCNWHWIRLKQKHESEELARQFIKANWDTIQTKYALRWE